MAVSSPETKTMRDGEHGHLWAVVFFAAAVFGYLLPSVDWFRAVPGNLGDARFNSVILEHLYLWVRGEAPSLWSPAFFYPFDHALAFSDNHFGSALPYILLRALGLGREHAFDGWIVFGGALNFLAAYLVLGRLRFSGLAAAGGAFVFAFALPALATEVHAQMVYRFAIPLAFLAFWRVFVERRVLFVGHLAFWIAVQFYCAIYLGIFLGYLLLASLLAIALVGKGRGLLRDLWRATLSAPRYRLIASLGIAVLSAAAIGWLLLQYLQVKNEYEIVRPLDEISQMLPTLRSYLIADGSLVSGWIGGWIPDFPMRHEHQMFFGIGVWVLAVIGAFVSFRQGLSLGRAALVSLVIMVVATLSIGSMSLYWVFAMSPGTNAIRAVARINLVFLLPLSVLTAIAITYLQAWWQQQGRPAAAALVGCLALVLLVPEMLGFQSMKTSIDDWQARVTDLKKLLPADMPPDPVLYVTSKGFEPFYMAELDGMVLAQDMGIPTLNGYSGHTPQGYSMPGSCSDFAGRLDGYAAFAGQSKAQIDAIADRVVVLRPTPCNRIANGDAAQVAIAVDDLMRSGDQLTADITVRNGMTKALDATATAGFPLRLSWRLVPLDGSGARVSEPDWVSRIDLENTIDASEVVTVPLRATLPSVTGSYLLEVSLVLEGVAWLHDLGMPIASVAVPDAGN